MRVEVVQNLIYRTSPCAVRSWIANYPEADRLGIYKQRCIIVAFVFFYTLGKEMQIKTADGRLKEINEYLEYLQTYPKSKEEKSSENESDMKHICIAEFYVGTKKHGGLVGDSKLTSDADCELYVDGGDSETVQSYKKAIDIIRENMTTSLQDAFDLNFYVEFFPGTRDFVWQEEQDISNVQIAESILKCKLARHSKLEAVKEQLKPPPYWLTNENKALEESLQLDVYQAFDAVHEDPTSTASEKKQRETDLLKSYFVAVQQSVEKEALNMQEWARFHFLKVEGYALLSTLQHFRTISSDLKELENIAKKGPVGKEEFKTQFNVLVENATRPTTSQDSIAAKEHLIDFYIHYMKFCATKKAKYLLRSTACCMAAMSHVCVKGLLPQELDILFRVFQILPTMKKLEPPPDTVTEGQTLTLSLLKGILRTLDNDMEDACTKSLPSKVALPQNKTQIDMNIQETIVKLIAHRKLTTPTTICSIDYDGCGDVLLFLKRTRTEEQFLSIIRAENVNQFFSGSSRIMFEGFRKPLQAKITDRLGISFSLGGASPDIKNVKLALKDLKLVKKNEADKYVIKDTNFDAFAQLGGKPTQGPASLSSTLEKALKDARIAATDDYGVQEAHMEYVKNRLVDKTYATESSFQSVYHAVPALNNGLLDVYDEFTLEMDQQHLDDFKANRKTYQTTGETDQTLYKYSLIMSQIRYALSLSQNTTLKPEMTVNVDDLEVLGEESDRLPIRRSLECTRSDGVLQTQEAGYKEMLRVYDGDKYKYYRNFLTRNVEPLTFVFIDDIYSIKVYNLLKRKEVARPHPNITLKLIHFNNRASLRIPPNTEQIEGTNITLTQYSY